MSVNFENSAMATGLKKVSFHSNPSEGQYQRMFKILQVRLQQYRNQELSDVISWVSKRQRTYTCPGLMYYIREESD